MVLAIRKHADKKGAVRHRVYVYHSGISKNIYVGSFDTVKEAREAERQAKMRIKFGEPAVAPAPREEVTFTALSMRWYKGLVGVRPATKRDYDQAIRRLRPYVGKKFVSAITRRDIDEIISALSDRYSPSTVRKTIVIFKMVLRMGVDHGHLDRLPLGATKLALPKIRKRVFEPLSPEQVKRLIACTPEYWQPFVRLLLTSGLRRSEAWGLRVQDLDLERGVIHVRGQIIKRKLVDLKTDAAYRDVPLPKATLEALAAHLSARPDNDLDLLFPTVEGKPVDPCNWYARIWVPTREKAGLPHFRLHDCRHHVASVYLSQGRSITYVQRLLGHSQPTTLLSIYSWVTKGEADIATSEFEKWLGEEERALYGSWAMVA